MKRLANKNQSVVEVLEGRMMMSASTLAISQVAVGNGVELQIRGTARNDSMTLSQNGQDFTITNNGQSETLTGAFSDIKLYGGSGNDSILVDSSVTTNCFLYGGAGKNKLQAGNGNDTLDCIGSTADTLIGGTGNDSFWMDNKGTEKVVGLRSDELAGGNVHKVNAFYAAPTASAKAKLQAKTRVSSYIVQPTTDGSTYADFSNHPLFSTNGPAENDIVQGQVGDCFFLSVLSSVAKVDPNRIQQSILDMGDGTYLVQFSGKGGNAFVHVNGQLPVNSTGNLEYAGLGTDGSTWVAIMEKAYASFRGTTASYASIDGGWMSDSYTALGCRSASFYGGTNAADLMNKVETALNAGESVTYGTIRVADGASLIAGHAYTVDSIVTDSHGTVTGLKLRNPWGIDGAGNDGHNDGYVVVTAQQAFDSMAGITWAMV